MTEREAFRHAIERWYRKNDGENAKWAREINDNLKRKPFTFEEEKEVE